MPENEDFILHHTEIIVEAVALSQAMLDGDLQEARFRARLIATTADIGGLGDVGRAAGCVVELLGRGSMATRPGYGQAIEALSVAITGHPPCPFRARLTLYRRSTEVFGGQTETGCVTGTRLRQAVFHLSQRIVQSEYKLRALFNGCPSWRIASSSMP
jgi:hypothetical protein